MYICIQVIFVGNQIYRFLIKRSMKICACVVDIDAQMWSKGTIFPRHRRRSYFQAVLHRNQSVPGSMLDGATNTDRRMCPWARHLTDIAPTQRSLMGCPNYKHDIKNKNHTQIRNIKNS